MTATDAKAETDQFLERSGPPTVDYPPHRESYYMLEAFCPNRGWDSDGGRWLYASPTSSDSQHRIDLMHRMIQWRREQREVKEGTTTAVAKSGPVSQIELPGDDVVPEKSGSVLGETT
jgi:hypothetical protein